MLEHLDALVPSSRGEHVAILVGPNGAGKSNLLKAIAVELRAERDLAVICNTAYDRFAGVRGIKRVSASRSGRSPKGIVKMAVARTIDEPSSRFYQIGKTLDYCGYLPRFGFKVETGSGPFPLPDEVNLDPSDYDQILAFLKRHNPDEILWVDPNSPALEYSFAREFAMVLRREERLRKLGILREIQVYLQRHDDQVIELLHASSGELALISSLVFLVTAIANKTVILIDEPENSLHPSWQREYVDKVLNAAEYRDVKIVIATHAPLVVTGALTSFPKLVSVFQIQDGKPSRLQLSGSSGGGSIEEILLRAFEVVTPANHYVSQQLVGVVTELEEGKIGRQQAIQAVNNLAERSFDQAQQSFFGAVRELIDRVDAEARGNAGENG